MQTAMQSLSGLPHSCAIFPKQHITLVETASAITFMIDDPDRVVTKRITHSVQELFDQLKDDEVVEILAVLRDHSQESLLAELRRDKRRGRTFKFTLIKMNGDMQEY